MKRIVSICVGLDSPALERLDAMAQADGRSRSSMLRWLIRNTAHPAHASEASLRPAVPITKKPDQGEHYE